MKKTKRKKRKAKKILNYKIYLAGLMNKRPVTRCEYISGYVILGDGYANQEE